MISCLAVKECLQLEGVEKDTGIMYIAGYP